MTAGISLHQKDFDAGLAGMKARIATAVGTPKVHMFVYRVIDSVCKVPEVRWSDVGGLADVKRDIYDTVSLPLKHPHLFADGVRKRSGA